MKKFIQFIKNTKRALGLGYSFAPGIMLGIFCITIATSLAPIFQAKLLGNIVDQIVSSLNVQASAYAVVYLVLGYAGIWGIIRIGNALQLYLEKIWHVKNEQGLELTVLKKRSEIDIGHYENPDFQNLLTRAFNRSFWPVFELADAQFQIFANIAVILVSSLLTSSISPLVYLIVIVSSLPGFFVQFRYGYKIWSIWGEHSERQRKYASLRHHIISRIGIVQVKLFQNSSKILGMISDIMSAFKKDQLAVDRKRFFMEIGAGLISAIGLGLSLLILANNILVEGGNAGTFVFAVSVLGSLIGSLNSFLRQIGVQMEKSFYATDIFEVLDTKPHIVRPKHPIFLNLETPPVIEFKNVSFKYQGRKDWILQNINLTINPGEKIALVGMNGAGKSTLVKLISRIYDPVEGDIFINNTNLKDLDLNEWSSYLSVLLQDYITYDLTAKESIAMGRISNEPSIEKSIEAAEYSGASEFIETWEKKYDQQIGKEFEGGIEPSKGQHQKIALARSIYRNAFIMILDEPTAAIDALSETQIFEAMEEAVGKNTLIVITHRFNTTQNMDKIIVIEKGSILETGTHKELMKHKGRYREMFNSQAKAFETKNEN